MEDKTLIGYHYACVIADKKYKDFVIVNEYDDNTEEIYSYELQSGETLVKANPPQMRIDASTDGFIKPVWDGEWKESATAKEIAKWEAENPAPIVEAEVSDIDILYELISDLYMEKDLDDMGMSESDFE